MTLTPKKQKEDEMEVKETLSEGLKREVSIRVEAEELDAKIHAKLVEAQPEIEMKGFRKGKVPLALLRKQFGQRLLGEAMQESVDEAMRQHFDASGDRPVSDPDIKMNNQEDWAEGQPMDLTMAYEKMPPIPDVDMASISLEKLVVKADDAEMDDTLTRLAEQAKSFATKEGAAEKGDQVVFDFAGRVDGELFEGGSAEDHALELGSGAFIPGFEEQLEGVSAGEEKIVNVTFPEEYGAEHLAGKDAEFTCTIKEVKAPQKAEIDDEMAKKFGADDLEALKGRVREQLEESYADAARMVLKRALLDHLDENVSFELPPTMVEAEAKQIAHQMWHDENPDVQGHDHPEIEANEEHTKLAERRVRLGLLLADIGQKAEVKVSDQELSRAVMDQARQYPGQEKAFIEFIQNNQQMLQQIQAPLFEEKVVDHIVAQAQITEREINKDELKEAVDKLEEI